MAAENFTVSLDQLVKYRAERRKRLEDASYKAWLLHEQIDQAHSSGVLAEGVSINSLQQRYQEAQVVRFRLREKLFREDMVDRARSKAMKLSEYRRCIGAEDVNSFAKAVTAFTGVTITTDLIYEAERWEGREKRIPMAAPKAEAICKYLSSEMGRTITPADIDGLQVV